MALELKASKTLTILINQLGSTLLLSTLVFIGIGCSRETSVYRDPTPINRDPVAPLTTQPSSKLPEQFFDQSINQARSTLQPDGLSPNGKVIELKTTAGVNPQGSFNGAGLGNKALLGLDFWNVPMAQVEPLSFDSKTVVGTEGSGVGLQIDLKCDGTLLKHVIALGSDVAALGSTAVSDGFYRTEVSLHDAIWSSDSDASPQPILDPIDQSVLVPALGSGTSALSLLMQRFPSACLRNGVVPGSELPKSVPTAAVQWTLGRASTSSLGIVHIRRFSLGSQLFDGLDETP